MPTLRLLIATVGTLIGALVYAANPEPGNSLPVLNIERRGELILESDTIGYRPWSSTHNPGTVHIVQYLAGTRSARDIFRPFTDSLKTTFKYTDYHVTTIVNLDDAVWGTGRFVVSEVEDKKRKYPLATMVLDENGVGRENWGLAKNNAVVVILDKQGIVLHVAEDAMTETQLSDMLKLVQQQIGG